MSVYTTVDSGEQVAAYDDETPQWGATILPGLSVHLSGPGEARCNGDVFGGMEWRCANCGQPLQNPEDNSGHWVSEEGEEWCDSGAAMVEVDGEEVSPHVGEPIPLSWANSAGIELDEERDEIRLRVSVGDPRGAFTVTIGRHRYIGDNGEQVDELRLSVPDPSDAWPHQPLTSLNGRGYFAVGQ